MVNVAIVGLGYWGPNLLRNFNANPDSNVIYAVDKSEALLEKFKLSFSNVDFVNNFDKILGDERLDAVVIATPVWSHFDLAKAALMAGKHVLVEKPMTSTLDEANELISIAEDKGLILMVDHTFLYTGAVGKIKELISQDSLGEIKYFDSTRINLGLFQADINVLWDLAPHDISILNYIIDEQPVSVQATGTSHTENGLENIAYLTLNYSSGKIAHFNCSWSSPVKIRSILIGGNKKMLLYNDMEPTEKVKVYDHGYEIKNSEEKNKIIADYRMGDISIPKLDMKEALAGVAMDFVKSIQNSEMPVSNMYIGRDVVKILEASDLSLKHQGKIVEL